MGKSMLLTDRRRLRRSLVYIIHLHHELWWKAVAVLAASLLCWTYLTIVFLSGTALFNLLGNLQVIHFENQGKLLRKGFGCFCLYWGFDLLYCLSKISHRFLIFALLARVLGCDSQSICGCLANNREQRDHQFH